MADGASSAEDSPEDDSDFSRTSTTTSHRKRLDDDSDLGRTRTATGQKKRSLISQTATHREERQLNDFSVFLSLLLLHIIHVPCQIHHLAYCTYSHFPPIPSSLLLIYQIHNLMIAARLKCEACLIRYAYA